MKKNIFLEILKILGAIIAGGFLWLIIFSFALPAAEDGSTSERGNCSADYKLQYHAKGSPENALIIQ